MWLIKSVKIGKHLGRPVISMETLSEEPRAILKANFEKWQANEIKCVEFMEMLELKNMFYKVVNEYKCLN